MSYKERIQENIDGLREIEGFLWNQGEIDIAPLAFAIQELERLLITERCPQCDFVIDGALCSYECSLDGSHGRDWESVYEQDPTWDIEPEGC